MIGFVENPLLEAIFPSKCGLCARFGPAICDNCMREFQALDSTPKPGSAELDMTVSLFNYCTRAEQAVHRLKYDRITSLVSPLAQLMRHGYDQQGLDRFDMVIPVPIHWRRWMLRGFNQSLYLSEAMPKGKVQTNVLYRIKATRPQVGLTREQRALNMSGAFWANERAKGRSVLLIDDVSTSGNTAEQCALALKKSGCTEVGLLTLTGSN
jgi:ComF family protein